MSITRWDPFRELETFNERLNRMFGRSSLLSQMPANALANVDWSPAVDVVETPEQFLVKAELPDLRKEDVKVSVEGGMLRISGERKQEKEEKHKRFHRIERSYGSFVRTFGLPDNIDEKTVQADFKDGLLTVHLQKTAPTKPQVVDVKIA